MRFYDFQIKSQGAVIKQFYGGLDTTTNKIVSKGVNVAFEIQIFSENISQIPASIRLDNVFTMESYKELLDYGYLTMEFYAGFLENSNYTKRNAYQNIQRTPLISAPITNIIPDFSTITRSVWFHFIPGNEIIARRGAFQQTQKFALKLTNGDNIFTKLSDYLKSLKDPYTETSDNQLTLKANDDVVKNLKYSGGDIVINGDNINHFLGGISNLAFLYNDTICNIQFYLNTQNQMLITLKNKNLLTTTSTKDNPITLYPQDFLSQPSLTNLSGQLNCITRLRNDITIGDYVKISGAKITTSGIAGQVSSGVGIINPAVLSGVINADNIYQVIAINHMGEYIATNANSWSTQWTLIPGDLDTSNLLFRTKE